MTRKLEFGLAAAILLGSSVLSSSTAQAQRMAPASASRVATVQAHPVRGVRTRRKGGLAGASFRTTSNGFAPASGSSLSLQQLLDPVLRRDLTTRTSPRLIATWA
jgi:hypothetical protein